MYCMKEKRKKVENESVSRVAVSYISESVRAKKKNSGVKKAVQIITFRCSLRSGI